MKSNVGKRLMTFFSKVLRPVRRAAALFKITLIPVADNRWYNRTKKTWTKGKVWLWELKWNGKEYYIADLKLFPYPTEDLNMKQYGHYGIWKGTYKH